jgi:(R,R)-butanediol dehydrogenase / meso-butanediol dehydrogenase / diacetyl reductase
MIEHTMQAALFQSEGLLVVKEVPLPRIQAADDVLVQVEACGVCGTDLRILAVPPVVRAKKGIVLGHEYLGHVVEAGPGAPHLKPGDRVVCIPDVACGHCSFCADGRPNLCLNMFSIGGDVDGGFAQYALAPAKALYPVSEALPVDEGAMIELLSCVLGGVTKAALMPGEDVLIVGAGPAGLVYLKVLRTAGAGRVIMAEPSPWRSQFALQAGADQVINPREVDLGEAVRAATGGGAQVVIDAVGSQLPAAMSAARKGARIIVFGEDHRAQVTIRQQDIQGKELRILGSFVGLHQFPLAVQMLETGTLQLSGLITHRLSLPGLPAGIVELAAGRGAKGVCFPWQ